MQIIIGIAVFFGGFITAWLVWLIGKLKLRIIQKRNERYLNDPICTGRLGLPRYKEDGSCTGPKTMFLTNYALKAEREPSERSETK